MKLREIKLTIKTTLRTYAIFAVIIAGLLILYSLISPVIDNSLTRYNNHILMISFVLNLLAFAGILFNDQFKKEEEQQKKDKLSERVKQIMANVKEIFSPYVTIDEKTEKLIHNKVVDDLFTYYNNHGDSSQIDQEIEKKLFNLFKSELKLNGAIAKFMKHSYLAKYNPGHIMNYMQSINKNNVFIEGTEESSFFKLLYNGTKDDNFNPIKDFEKIKEIKIDEELTKFINKYIDFPNIIKILENKLDDQKKLERLTKIVNRCILKGYISSRGIKKLLKDSSSIFCIIKNEAGLSGVKHKGESIFQKQMTPFKKILTEYGFLNPFKYEYFVYMIPSSDIPDEFKDNIELFMKQVILPKINKEWLKLQKEYPTIKKIQNGPSYKYLSFIIHNDEFFWEKLKQEFGKDFEDKIIGKLDKNQIIKLFISQTHKLPTILKKMELDSFVDSGKDRIKESLRFNQEKINASLKEVGYDIDNILDYKKLKEDINLFAKILQESVNIPKKELLSNNLAKKIAEEIITSAEELSSLMELSI